MKRSAMFKPRDPSRGAPSKRMVEYTRWLAEFGFLAPSTVEFVVGTDNDRDHRGTTDVAESLVKLWDGTVAPVTTPDSVLAEVEVLLAAAPPGAGRDMVRRRLMRRLSQDIWHVPTR